MDGGAGPAGKAVGWWVLKRDPAVGEKPLALSGDGGTLFTDTRGQVVARDPETGKEKHRVKVGPANVPSLIWNPNQFAASTDGTRIAVAQRNEQGPHSSLRVFDVKTGKELAAHDLGRREGMSVAFDRTASRVVVWAMVGDTSVCDAEGTAKPRKLDAGSVRPTRRLAERRVFAVSYEDGTLIWGLVHNDPPSRSGRRRLRRA